MRLSTEFFRTSQEIANYVGGSLLGNKDLKVGGVNTLKLAECSELSFYSGALYRTDLESTGAGVVILSNSDVEELPDLPIEAIICVDDVQLAYAKAAQFLFPTLCAKSLVSPAAKISNSATIADGVEIGAGVVIDEGTTIASGVVIGANSVVGSHVSIGEGSRLDMGVMICPDSVIGSQCHFLSGSVIGSDGFGFARDKQANSVSSWVKVPQLGRVIIGDRVHIGANTCIDRGSIGDTILEDDVIIDNLVQIAHNVKIGCNTAIAGCAAIAGSTTIGQDCLIAGRASIVGHLEICNGVQINADSLVTKSISKAGVYASNWPARPVRQWRRFLAGIQKPG